MNNYQPSRKPAYMKKRSRLRFEKVKRRLSQAWGHKFKLKRLDSARAYEARRLRQGHPEMTLIDSRIAQFLNELRRG